MQCSFALTLALLAAATIALSVADLVLTTQFYCNGQDYYDTYCSASAEPYVWVWVASGIWAGIPLFFTGIYLMTDGADLVKLRYATLLILLAAFVFTPAIVILTIVELAKGSSSTWNFYQSNSGSLGVGNIDPDGTNPWQAKFAIPLTVLILALLMWLMTMWLCVTELCCAREKIEVVSTPVAPPPCPAVVATPYPAYIPAPAPRPACVPCGQAAAPIVSVGCNTCPGGGGGGYSVNVGAGPTVSVNTPGSPYGFAPSSNVYRSW